MKKPRRALIVGLMGLLVCLAFLFACSEKQSNTRLFWVEIGTDQFNEQIVPWKDENGDFYVFLPGYADLSKAQIKVNSTGKLRINNIESIDGMLCDAFQLNTAYELEVMKSKETQTCQLTFVQSANVATMYIDTTSGSMKHIHAAKGNEESGEIRLYTADGKLNYYGDLLNINGRGNATWLYQEKKPYSIKLSAEADLLNMGTAQKWILLANAYDPSNMRNKIVFDFAKEVGLLYSPDSQWVDLYLNGEYTGLYLLCERNEVQEERVNISPETGYLVSMELEERLAAQNYPYVLTKEKQALRIYYAPSGDDTGKTVLRAFQSVENALLAEDGIDPDTGKHWTELIDLDSWVRKYLIEEIFASNDGGFMSQFFYFDTADDDGKVYAGPVWDFDVSLGNTENWQFTEPNAFYARRLFARDTNHTPWFYSLYKKEQFYDCLIKSFETEFLPVLEDLLNSKMMGYTQRIKKSTQMNQTRWACDKDAGMEANRVIHFLKQRIEFLSAVWLEGKCYFEVSVNQGNNAYYAYYAIAPGECMPVLPVLPDEEYQTFLGWYYADTDEPFDSSVPITQDTEIYAKWADSQQKKVGQVIKLMPLAIIACLGVGILWADIRRMRKGG